MNFFVAVVNMVPNLIADLSPKDRADITKIVVIVTGTLTLGKYVADRYFGYLESKPKISQDNPHAALNDSTTVTIDQQTAA